jgi:hypothetical protein
MLIDLYLKEKMYNQAQAEVLSKRSLSTLRLYQNDLAFRYPEQYFKVYCELIIPFADKSMGRKHYQEVVSYLKQMKSMEACFHRRDEGVVTICDRTRPHAKVQI